MLHRPNIIWLRPTLRTANRNRKNGIESVKALLNVGYTVAQMFSLTMNQTEDLSSGDRALCLPRV